ncbi:MAG: hypothetical protein H6Q10_3401 [Acidobacteria bacterium]|nr:hypothetical protein [Acidobacteriota bacterium]
MRKRLACTAAAALVSAVLAAAVSGCAPMPRQRPVEMGPVDTGAGSLESVRRQLEGAWTLVSLEAFDQAGVATPVQAKGLLTYDAYGNMTAQGTFKDERLPGARGVLDFSGRAVIDVKQNRLLLSEQNSNVRFDEGTARAISPDKFRYYEFEGDLLKITIKDAAGAPQARSVWRKNK